MASSSYSTQLGDLRLVAWTSHDRKWEKKPWLFPKRISRVSRLGPLKKLRWLKPQKRSVGSSPPVVTVTTAFGTFQDIWRSHSLTTYRLYLRFTILVSCKAPTSDVCWFIIPWTSLIYLPEVLVSRVIRAQIRNLLNFGAKIYHAHCSSIFVPWF